MRRHTENSRDNEVEEELILVSAATTLSDYGTSTHEAVDGNAFYSMHICWLGFVWLMKRIVALGLWLLKPIAFASVLREIFFAMLMYFALRQSMTEGVNLIEPNIDVSESVIISGAAIMLAVFNLINDWLSVSPADAVAVFVHKSREKNTYLYAFKLLILMQALMISYTVGSCSDALGLSVYINQIQDKSTRNIVRDVVLGTTIFLGNIYYAMMTTDSIQLHVNKFIKACRKPQKTWVWMKLNALGLIHATIISLGNIIYRPILFASILSLIISLYYGANSNTSWSNALKIVAMLSTAVTTLFSRTLRIITTYAPIASSAEKKDMVTLISNNFKEAPLTEIVKFVGSNSVFPLIRAVGLGLLSNWLSDLSLISVSGSAAISIIVGTIVFVLSLYIELQSDLYHRSIATLILQNKNNTNDMIAEPIVVDLSDERGSSWENAHDDFENRIKAYQLSKPMEIVIETIIVVVRFARVVGFPVFLKVLMLSFNVFLSLSALFGLTFFAAGEVAHSELHCYRDWITKTVKSCAVKLDLIKNMEPIALQDSESAVSSEQSRVMDAYRKLREFGTAIWRDGSGLLIEQSERCISGRAMRL